MRPLDHWDLQTNLQSNYAALDGMRHHKSEWSREIGELGRTICYCAARTITRIRLPARPRRSHLDLPQGRHAVPDVESIAARRASERNIRGNAGGRYVKLKIAMADAKATAPSVRADGPDDAEARCGHQYGAPRGWWVSLP